jgi:hypothetical protein
VNGFTVLKATAEVVGRRSRSLGLRSVAMKVNGFTHFRRKMHAMLSSGWRCLLNLEGIKIYLFTLKILLVVPIMAAD